MYTREPLEYSTLKPVIGDETLFVHYNKHYLGYLEKLNNLDGVKIVCSTKKIKNNVKRVLTDNKNCDTISIVIGPEGGLDESEENQLNNNGFISTTLGNRIMRVESVPLFILSVINYEYME